MTRIRYYDFLRSICVCLIVFYHMVVQLTLSEICPVQDIVKYYQNANMHIATLGVAVFFMLSGASLAYTAKGEFTWSQTIRWYVKRLSKLLIPYYIANLVYFAYLFWRNRGFEGIYPCEIPAWRFIFSLAGVDTWLSSLGARTFSLSIGEWFLGCLIIMYGLFPFLLKFMRRNRYAFLGLFTGLYAFMILTRPWDMAIHMNLLVKLFEFVLGMYLGSFCLKFDKRLGYVSVPVLLFFLISPVSIDISYAFKITLVALALWVSLSYTEPVLNRISSSKPALWKIIDMISSYSYEVFLVHHVVIYLFTPRFAMHVIENPSFVVPLFLMELIVTIIGAFFLKLTAAPVIKWISALLNSRTAI